MAIALQLQNNKFLHNEKIEITTIAKMALWPYITQNIKIRAEKFTTNAIHSSHEKIKSFII